MAPRQSRRRHLAVLLTSFPVAMATSAPSSLPQVDFSRMGQVALGGSFAGLDWWTSSSSFATNSSSEEKFSATADTLFAQNADGSFTVLGNANSGGTIHALCWSNTAMSSADSPSAGTLYVGGSFSSLSGTASSNVIAYSLSSKSFYSLSTGLIGTVNSVFCDNSNGQVWFGGEFAAPSGQTGENVALWSTSSQAWQAVPFGGLNGAVESIGPGSSASSVLFGGQFTTSFSGGNSTNSSSQVSIESAPSGVTTTGLSGYLTPVTLPSASAAWGNLTITAGPSTDQSQYSDPEVLLCPGTGTYLGRDNSVTQVEILGYNYLRAWGARIANAHVEGRSATTFCITSLPDNTQLNMTFVDPQTGKNATCWEHCPLSPDSSIAGQDFIFTDGPRSLTGLQLQLKEWTGDGPGLSSLQLLSDGAYASAVQSANTGRCSGSTMSTAQQSGQWTQMNGPTDIAGTVTPYAAATIPISNPTSASVTFYPYVSSSGYYDVYVVTPGCDAIGDCASRTSVDVEVFPKAGGLGWTSTISEQVHTETKSLVYSGWIDASSSAFSTTISLALAKQPAAPQSGDNYVVVAQSVELVLRGVYENGQLVGSAGAGINSTTTSSSSTTLAGSKASAFGVFEYVRSTSYNSSAATSTLSNKSETAITQLGFSLASALNASNAMTTGSVNAVTTLSGMTYVAGSFVSNNDYSNVISVSSDGKISALASQGLNGIVHASTSLNNLLYFGGEFTSVAQSGTALQHVAQYDPKSNAWTPLSGGADGPVLSLSAVTGSASQLLVTGNFTNVFDSNNMATRTGGIAVWDTSKSAWMTSAGVLGDVSIAAESGSSSFFAGRVMGITSNSANGFAVLSTDKNGAATLAPMTGASLGDVGSAGPVNASAGASKRALQAHRTRSLYTRFTDVVKGSRPLLSGRATPPTIPQQAYDAPAVLAGAYWTNSSATAKPSITVLGGNFTAGSGAGEIGGLAFYSNNQLSGPVSPVAGVVRTVAVVGDEAWIGGSGVNVSGVGAGLVVYDLAGGAWKKALAAALGAASGNPLAVNSIKQRPNTNTVAIAGNFASAGSLTCPALCLWDSANTQWTQPSSALTSGEIRSIDFADGNSDTLVVAGSFVLNGAVSYAASYSFGNSTWRDMTGLPGPALAIAVDDKNAGSIFASGFSASDGLPYLQAWDGQRWTAQNQSLQTGSLVHQLAFVPMRNEHTALGFIEKDRMLMVSGELYLENVGNVSSALYDGSSWYPYLVAQTSSGTLGAAAALFWSESSFSFAVHHYLARGLVVLVAIAIATGLVLLLILLGLLYAYVRRQLENRKAPPPDVYEKEGSVISSTHQDVLNSVQAALEQSLAPGGAASGAAAAAAIGRRRSEDSNYDSIAGAAPYESDDEEEGRLTHMRFDFDGPELQPGEMSMKAGQEILVLDDQASTEWFYARDPATGREGVVPASYIW